MKAGVGCVLVHGYGGTPYEMQGLGEVLREQGWQVSIPVLPGHGKTLDALQQTRFAQWQRAVCSAYDALAATTEHTFVIGLSMGGTLALGVGEQRCPAGVVTIAAPVFLYRFFPWQATDWRLPLVPLLRFVRPMWPTGGSSEQAREIAPWQGYEGAQPLHALNSFLRGLRQVRAGLPRIESPVLTLHAEGDQTVLVDNAWEIMRRVRARIRRLELFRIRERTTSHHVLTTHRETRDRVAASVAGFIQDCVAPGS